MKFVKYEFLKIITNKLFIFTFLVLWFMNLLFLNYQNYLAPENDIPSKAYKLLETDLKDKNNSEKGKYINQLYERAKAINIIYNIQSSIKSDNPAIRDFANNLRDENKELYNKYYEESKNPKWRYTGDENTELSFLETIKNDYDKVNNYHKYLSDIIDESETIENASIFKSKDKVSLKSISKTADAYKKMQDISVSYEASVSAKKIASTTITDFFVLILVFLFSTILIIEEKEKNLFNIIKSTKNGYIVTIISKIVSLFIGVFFICVLFYGINYIYYFITLGYGNIFSPIQSVSMFMLSTIKVNILEYILIIFFAKWIYMVLLGILIFYLSIKLNNISEVLMILFIIVLINLFIFNNIDITSNINLFHSFNLINLINTNEIFRIYDNLRFFNILVSKTSSLLILQILMVITFIILSIFKYLKSMKSNIKENMILGKLKRFKLIKNIRLNNIFSFELYKMLVINKCFLIIILFLLFILYDFKNQNFSLSYNEMFYKNYMDILSGELNEKKEKLIKEKLEEYEYAERQLEIINNKVIDGELSNIDGMILSQPYEDILATKNVFNRIENKYNYIKENKNASFVYDTGYNQLFRINKSYNSHDIYLILITIISILGLFVMEYRTGFIQILNTTKNGRIKTARGKVLVSIIVCTFIYIISIVPEILKVYKMYGFTNINESIVSLEVFSNLPSYISIFNYLIIFYVVRYISYILIILLIEFISLKFKNIIFSFIVSIFVLLMPYILSMLNIFKIDMFPFMDLSIVRENIIYVFIIPFIVIVIIFLYNSVVKRLE